MRAHPWNIRRTSHSHVLNMQMLSDLHSITLDGLAELDIDAVEFLGSMPNMSPGLAELWDDTLPEDLLSRLHSQISSLQGILLNRSKKEHTLERLYKSANASGANSARRRWPELQTADLRNVVATLRNHPGSLLFKRAISNEVHVLFRSCPHVENVEHANELCDLHFHWMQGYVSALCPDRILKLTRESFQPCVQKWLK